MDITNITTNGKKILETREIPELFASILAYVGVVERFHSDLLYDLANICKESNDLPIGEETLVGLGFRENGVDGNAYIERKELSVYNVLLVVKIHKVGTFPRYTLYNVKGRKPGKKKLLEEIPVVGEIGFVRLNRPWEDISEEKKAKVREDNGVFLKGTPEALRSQLVREQNLEGVLALFELDAQLRDHVSADTFKDLDQPLAVELLLSQLPCILEAHWEYDHDEDYEKAIFTLNEKN